MKHLGKFFYLVLAFLTVGVLGSLAAWAWTKDNLWLYLMLALFPVYLFHLLFNLIYGDKLAKRRETERSAFLTLIRENCIVYMTYLGSPARVKRPSKNKKDYLVHLYDLSVDRDLLKRHLWFDLPEAEEKRLSVHLLAETAIAYPLLADIRGRQVFVQTQFYRAAERSPLFADFLSQNTFTLYGDDHD